MKGKDFLKSVKDQAKCQCGESRKALFEFAHYDRRNKCLKNGKTVDMSKLKSQKMIEHELNKGRFLCVFCHRDETVQENIFQVDNFAQTLVMKCQKHRMFKGGNTCTGVICRGRKLNRKHFMKCKSKCDSCVSLEKIGKRKLRQKYINERKIEYRFCEYCKEECKIENVHQFEWDHIFGKNASVSNMRDSPIKTIENEIRLCRLLCLRCHRLKSILEAKRQWRGDPLDFQLLF